MAKGKEEKTTYESRQKLQEKTNLMSSYTLSYVRINCLQF